MPIPTMVTCECGAEGVAKTSKTGKIYYVCPTCPGSGNYKEKFLTFLDNVDEYNSKKGNSNKRKRDEKPKQDKKAQKVEEPGSKALMAKVDLILYKLERVLDHMKPKESEDEVETDTEKEE